MSNIIIPGDSIPQASEGRISIGPGVYKIPRTGVVIPSSAGLYTEKHLKPTDSTLIFIDSNSKRYIPQVNDYVIGIITGVYAEFFKVQLQDFSPAVQLSMFAFPNATKKNRPNLKIGQAVYARVSKANPDVDVELECIDATTGKDGGFGLLDESGYIFDINLNFARELLFNKQSKFLEKLASRCAFEIAIGINGKVWLKCGDGIAPKQQPDLDEDLVEGEDGELVLKPKVQATDNTSIVKDLKMTLAASRFLTICQSVNPDKVDDELAAAFKNV